jgi:uncharacterized protein YcbK (DUF882 family)
MLLAVLQTVVTAGLLAAPAPPADPALTAARSVSSHDIPEVRRLRLRHTHTSESIDVVYREGDEYVSDAISQLDHFLRDSRTGAVHHFDPRLFDLLSDLTAALGRPDAEIDVVCGYRTPGTNAYLRRRSRRVAKHSLHMEAEAIDIRVPGVTTRELQNAALALNRGGVGYYGRSNFVHVDIGPVRRW